MAEKTDVTTYAFNDTPSLLREVKELRRALEQKTKGTVIETYRDPLGDLPEPQTEPSCFNYMVRVVRYRVTVEEIEEPIENIHARIQDLWDHSDNHHDAEPLKAAAKKHGYTLLGKRGSAVKVDGARRAVSHPL